jgi:SAM-dependent methyltransferase
MFKTYNYFRQYNEGNPINDYKDFYKDFSNQREFGGEFSHMDHLVKNRFIDTLSCIIKIILRKQPNSILDVGCGLGVNLPISRLFPKIKYDGLDYAEVTLLKAKEEYQNVSFFIGDAFDMPFEEQIYDLLIISSVLILYEDINDQRKLLLEAKRVLKNDGVLVVVVWNNAFLLKWCIILSRVIARFRRKNLPQDFMGVHFSNRELKSVVESVGLEVRQIYNISADYGVLESVRYLNMGKYNRKFGKFEGEYGTIKNQNLFRDLLLQSGGPAFLLAPLYFISRIAPSLFNMFSVCVCEKK